MIRLFLFVLGLTAMATQVIMIREFLAIFHGNELIIGLFLGFWMVLTAVGAFLAVQSSKSSSQFAFQFKSTIDNRQSTIDNHPSLLSIPAPPSHFIPSSSSSASLVPSGIMPGIGDFAGFIPGIAALLPGFRNAFPDPGERTIGVKRKKPAP